MDDAFKINIDQLRDGQLRKIVDVYTPDFLEIQEKELIFTGDVRVKGEAYLAEEELVLRLKVEAEAEMPCSICNEAVRIKIVLDDFYHAEPLVNIRGGIYHFGEALREEILLAVPHFTECNQGQCPHRKEVEKFFSKNKQTDRGEEGFQPFADL